MTCYKNRTGADNIQLRLHHQQQLKILVVGDLGTGKTSLINRYVHQLFSENYTATVGVAFNFKVIQRDNNSSARLLFWDIAGQERYGSMTRVFYKEAVGALIVFDVSRPKTFDSVARWKSELDSCVQLADGSPIPCILLANKCDMAEYKFSFAKMTEMDDYCTKNGFQAWYETSVKKDINIDIAVNALVTEIFKRDTFFSKDGDQLILANATRKISLENCICASLRY